MTLTQAQAYNNPIFTISDTGSPTQSNGSSNGGLRIVSMRHFTKRTASVRSYGALVEWEALAYTTTHSNHMSIYNIKDKQQPFLTTCRYTTPHDTTHHMIQHKSLSEWPEHLYMLGLQGMLVLRERRH